MSRRVFPSSPHMYLRTRIALCAFVVLAFLLLIILLYVSLYHKMVNDQIENTYQLLSTELDGQVERQTESLRNIATAISYSRSVQGALYAATPLERFESLTLARDYISNFEALHPELLNIRIFDNGRSNVAVNDAYARFEADALAVLSERDQPQFTQLLQTGSGILSFMYVLPFHNVLYYSSSPGASETCLCTLLYRLDSFVNTELFTMGSVNYLAVSDGTCYAFTPMNDGIRDQLADADTGIQTLLIDGEAYIVYGFQLPATSWRLTYALPRSSVVSISAGLRGRYIFWLICSATVVIAFVLYNLCYIAYGIHKVTRSIPSAQGAHKARIESSNLPEIRMLANQLNELLDCIERANAEKAQAQQNVYNAMLSKNRAEMAFYRNQINPHFLFNTLECIRSMAQHCGAESVELLISSTSSVLQYSLYSDVIVSFRDELNNARHYINLMNSRAMNAYLYRENVDPALLDSPMVSMILQPVLENAFLHGAKRLHGRRFILSLHAVRGTDGSLEIRIADNGCGISPDQLEKLNHCAECVDDLDFKQNLGMTNIARRLKLADARCEIRFLSVEGHYTCVLLHIPATLSLQSDLSRVRSL